MSSLEVGFAKRDITPRDARQTIRHRAGQRPDETTPVCDPLYVRATAFRSAGEAAIWATADVLCVDGRLRSGVAEKLAAHTIPPEQVKLCATRTHTAPTVVPFHGIEPTPTTYLHRLQSAIAEAAVGALRSARPATIALEKAAVDLSVNRREIGRLGEVNDIRSPTGTAALEVALRAVGVRLGDEVIVPAYTFVATAGAVRMVNAVPVFVDILAGSIHMDPAAVERAVNEDTKAVIPVHLAGRSADMDGILAVAERYAHEEAVWLPHRCLLGTPRGYGRHRPGHLESPGTLCGVVTYMRKSTKSGLVGGAANDRSGA